MTANSPFVDRLTRQWLRRSHAELSDMLDDLDAVLVRHRETSLCGLVYDTAGIFGVPDDLREAVATAAELFYCGVGLMDDLQDGDADDYLPLPPAQQHNIAVALKELAMLRLLDVVPAGPMLAAVVWAVADTAVQMTLSQREELAARATGYQPPWDVDAYERVAWRAAGVEVGLLMLLAGVAVDLVGAAGVRDEHMARTLHRVGLHLGVLLQIRVDFDSRDERVTVLPVGAVDELRRRQTELFKTTAQALTPELVALLGRVAGLET